jgi:hypothetical protein
MARFRLQQAFHFGSVRVRAGGTLADSQANAVGNDAVYTGLNANSVPYGAVPLDGSATTMFNASRWAGTSPPQPSGVQSIDA